MLTIEHVLDLPQGQDFYLRQDTQSAVWIYTVDNNIAKLYKAPVVNGNWDTLTYTEQKFNTFEKDLTGLSGNEMGDTSVIVYKHTKSMSILKMPADSNRYVYDDVYRLYWAVDSRKLYMNIANNWEMIGTLRHELLDNVGTLSHDEIEDKLNQIEQILTDISSAVATLNGMNGDITIAQGNNVTVTKDEATKKLTIESTDTVTTVNGLKGSVVVEAGDNVSISQPTGTNKIVIAAAGSGVAKTPQNLTVTTWGSSSRKPKSFGGIYTFKKDVEITSITTQDDISAMNDAVLLVYKQVPYEMLKALVSNTDTGSSIYIDVSTVAPVQYIPIENIGNISVKVNANEVVAFIIYSPSGKVPATLSYGGYDANAVLDKARCLVASDGTTSTFMTAGDGYPETYSLILTFKA